MSISKTTRKELIEHLQLLGVSKGDKIVVHSQLISFGIIEGGIECVYNVLRQAIGPEGTLAVPNYIFDINGKTFHDYDPASSPSPQMGVLSEYVRKLAGVHRSRCPIHNHSVIGQEAAIVDNIVGDVSFGEGSDFQAFYEAGFSLLLLGCNFSEGASYIHHVEALYNVPYRKWLKLQRRIKLPSGCFKDVICHYCSRKDDRYGENFNAVGKQMMKESLLTTAPCNYGKSYYMKLADLHACVSRMIKKDPYAVV